MSDTSAKRTTKTTPKSPKAKPAEKQPGRRSAFVGMLLTSTQESNPRKKETAGHKSHAIIMRTPGISYEEFRKRGGRSVDLAWDIERGYVKTKKG